LVLFSLPTAPRPMVYDPEAARRRPTFFGVQSQELERFVKGAADARITLHVEPALERSAKVRNVAGVLRGSDPALRDSYVLLTAHYDHVGTRATGDDKIFNGANDDGSGTVSVIEIAAEIARTNPRPKRSIVFMTFFGEELGMVGSRYYARHPLVPLSKTVADLNLEQVGRTDDSEGPQVAQAVVTGFDFSSMTETLVEAGKQAGIRIYKRSQGDQYFSQSDNLALAEAGVPAHTLGVSFEFPDYHGVGDEWHKIDYANMAKVDDAVALGLLRLASDAEPPKWNESVGAAKKYAEASRKLH
jgi:Zn-dependent M28 family amino/carboxypeptidase